MSKKSTKGALLASGISLLLCFTMLLGTTFAWFTDSVSTTNNIITAGNLDVELYHKQAKESAWSKVDANTNVFKTGTLWEPGHAEVVNLKIANEGTLDMMYQLGVNIASEVGSVNVAGEDFKLSDYIKYAVIAEEKTYNSSADAISAAELANPTKLNVAYNSGNIKLNDHEDKYVTVIVYMPTSVGNEANYRGANVPTINLGINLYATQLNSEEDSFGPDYDAGLESSEEGTERELSDGSTVFYYNEESGYGDRVRLTAIPENLGTEYVVPEEVNDLGGALVNVTLDKLTLPKNLTYAYKSIEGANIGEVVIPEGTTTIPNRLFYKANVDTVVIPASVQKIEESAFQQVNLKEIVIPATVAELGYQAFGASTVEKVTFEGDIILQNRVFRSAPALRIVEFKGDVTFVNNSGYDGNGCWFCNSGSNNPNVSNIAFYTPNDTVAEKVKVAMGAEVTNANNSKVKIYSGANVYFVGANHQ